MKNFDIFIVNVLMFCGLLTGILAADEICFENDYSDLEGFHYYEEHLKDNLNRHKELLATFEKSQHGHSSGVKKLLEHVNTDADDYINNLSNTLWLSSLTDKELGTLDLCAFSRMLNNSITENEAIDVRCMRYMDVYLNSGALYKLVRKTLREYGCDTKDVPIAELPECYKPPTCQDYNFNAIWKKYGTEDLYEIVKTLYNSDDRFDNYVAAVFTANLVRYTAIWDQSRLDPELLLKVVQTLGVFEDALNSARPCDCKAMEKALVGEVQDYQLAVTIMSSVDDA